MYSFELAVVVCTFLEGILFIYLYSKVNELKKIKGNFFSITLGMLIGTLLAIIFKS